MAKRSISSETIVQEAIALGGQIEYLDKRKNLFYISLYGERHLFKNVDCGLNSSLGKKIALDKRLTQIVLEKNNIPFPQSRYLRKDKVVIDEIRSAIENNFPVVVKPIDKSQGRGITTNISSKEDLMKAIAIAYKHSHDIVVQKQVYGDDFRIMVVGDKVVAVTQRIAPYIIGDGVHSIQECIEQENKNPLRGKKQHTKPMNQIIIDNELTSTIAREGRTLESIPLKDQKISLKGTANISAGGEARDRTDELHPSIAKVCIKIAQHLKLKVVGIDLMTKDISQTLEKTNGVFIEVNDTPGIWIHHYPAKGKSRNVAGEIIKLLYTK